MSTPAPGGEPPAARPPTTLGPPAYPFLNPPRRENEIGRLGNYRAYRTVAESDTAVVLLSDNRLTGAVVALKVLKPAALADPAAKTLERFHREGRITATLRHEVLLPTLDAGSARVEGVGEVWYLVMPYLEGQTLATRLARLGRLPLPDVLRLGRALADGLRAMHEHQPRLVHRDVRPANVFLTSGGGPPAASGEFRDVRLLDFGLARAVDDREKLSQHGTILGAAGYMAPEQARGRWLDGRADLYSLGATLYEAATGRAPYGGGNLLEVLYKVAHTEPVPADRVEPSLPSELSVLLMMLLSKRPQDRPRTAQAVVEALRALAEGRPVPPIPTEADDPNDDTADEFALPDDDLLPEPSSSRRMRTLDAPNDGSEPRQRPTPPESGAEVPTLPFAPRPPVPRPGWPVTVIGSLSRLVASAPSSSAGHLTVFGPPRVAAGSLLLIQVYAHLPGAGPAAAGEPDFTSLEWPSRPGVTLGVHLRIPGFGVQPAHQRTMWHGRPVSVSFAVRVPASQPLGPAFGTALLHLDSVPCGHLGFALEVVPPPLKDAPEPRPLAGRAVTYRRAYASYAEGDREVALERLQLFTRLGVQISHEVLTLDPAERWSRHAYRHIDTSDLFVMFWSQAARDSEWVRKELQHALARRGGVPFAGPEILPVPVEGPPPVAPIDELRPWRLKDHYLYFLPPAGAREK
jgi:serine/threonine protein kinase